MQQPGQLMVMGQPNREQPATYSRKPLVLGALVQGDNSAEISPDKCAGRRWHLKSNKECLPAY